MCPDDRAGQCGGCARTGRPRPRLRAVADAAAEPGAAHHGDAAQLRQRD